MTTPSPALDGNDYISTSTEYFKLGKAAGLLGISAEDLLHIGAVGKAEILAPVLAAGVYEWLLPFGSKEYSELAEPAKYYFDASERILLSSKDVARIEAQGWAIPAFFYSPFKAQEIDELLQRCAPELPGNYEPDYTMSIRHSTEDQLKWAIKYLPSRLTKPDADLSLLRKALYYASWHPIELLSVTPEKTTISHLFISKEEVKRLKAGVDQDADTSNRNNHQTLINQVISSHGNAERFAQTRESILIAAIYCKARSPEMCKTVPDWVRQIELVAAQFWPQAQTPPLASEKINRMLNAALKGSQIK